MLTGTLPLCYFIRFNYASISPRFLLLGNFMKILPKIRLYCSLWKEVLRNRELRSYFWSSHLLESVLSQGCCEGTHAKRLVVQLVQNRRCWVSDDETVLEVQHSTTRTSLMSGLMFVYVSVLHYSCWFTGLLGGKTYKTCLNTTTLPLKTCRTFGNKRGDISSSRVIKFILPLYTVLLLESWRIIFFFVCFFRLLRWQCYILLKSWHILTQRCE